MGCKGSKHVEYEYKLEKRRIPLPQARTLQRWGDGAIARHRFKNMKKALFHDIIALKKPLLVEGKLAFHPKEQLLQEEEFEKYYEAECNKYIWDKNPADVAESKEDKGQRVYVGQRLKKQNHVWEGLGIVTYADGAEYQGFTKDQLFNGKGRLTHKNGDIYQGEWKDGKAHGRGTFVQVSNLSTYEGDWVDDEMHGQGTEVWDNGKITYTGDFKQGSKTGKGKLEAEGHTYEGEFEDGKFHGEGRYSYPLSKKVLEGQFKNNELVKGKMILEDGSVYEGEFKKNMMNGKGHITYPNGSVFVGTFENDQKHGIGTLFDFKTQTKQREEWLKGSRKNFIKTPASEEEFQQQLKNPGYIYNSVTTKVKTQGLDKVKNKLTAVSAFKGRGNGLSSKEVGAAPLLQPSQVRVKS
uniref:MORN repeat protein n=1 Tax=Strombidium rassoulzadegani TaxID=1082188 RepID=A0A7S3CPV0_9SPIT|mmetsp:Transcript_2719/g.4621  ORF Transcript_2719/g.4621 Transcript_2719/m.4621 type:complete len:409 (+) Transcript_2719:38-1264(+)